MVVSGRLRAAAVLPRERTGVTVEQVAGCAVEPVRTQWATHKSVAPTEIRTPDRPARISTILTTTSRLS